MWPQLVTGSRTSTVSLDNEELTGENSRKLRSKRFAKKQQMQWTKKSAHLVLQMRTKVLDERREETFRDWYPDFRTKRLKHPLFYALHACAEHLGRSLRSLLARCRYSDLFNFPACSYTLGCWLFCVTLVSWIPTSARSSPSSSL